MDESQTMMIVTLTSVGVSAVLAVLVGRLWGNRRFIAKLITSEVAKLAVGRDQQTAHLDARFDTQTARIDGLAREVSGLRSELGERRSESRVENTVG